MSLGSVYVLSPAHGLSLEPFVTTLLDRQSELSPQLSQHVWKSLKVTAWSHAGCQMQMDFYFSFTDFLKAQTYTACLTEKHDEG